MHYNKILLAASLLLSSALVSVKADNAIDTNAWYAVYTDDFQFLDSSKSEITVNAEASVDAVNGSKDKGQRFRFPEGANGKVVCQAHMDHFVGYDPGSGKFRTDFGDSDGKTVTVQLTSDNKVYFNNGQNFISSSGQTADHQFNWNFKEINMAAN